MEVKSSNFIRNLKPLETKLINNLNPLEAKLPNNLHLLRGIYRFIRRCWGAVGPKRPYFGRLVPLRATRSESVPSLNLCMPHNIHSLKRSFASNAHSLKRSFAPTLTAFGRVLPPTPTNQIFQKGAHNHGKMAKITLSTQPPSRS